MRYKMRMLLSCIIGVGKMWENQSARRRQAASAGHFRLGFKRGSKKRLKEKIAKNGVWRIPQQLCFLCLLREGFLAYAAQRADKIGRQVFPLGACCDAVIRIAGGLVVDIATDIAYILLHGWFLSLSVNSIHSTRNIGNNKSYMLSRSVFYRSLSVSLLYMTFCKIARIFPHNVYRFHPVIAGFF